MASPAHELDVCFLHEGDDDPDEYLLPLPVMEESDDDCTRQMRSDVSAAKQVDPTAFKQDVQIKPSEEVPVGSKFLNVSGGAQAVRGILGARCVAGSIIADGQVTARGQRVWLNCNDEFILDEELAGVVEEPLGDNRGFSESRDQKRVCVWSVTGNNHPVFSQQVSKSRAQRCRWAEAKLKKRRRGKREREELRSSSQTWRETSTKSCVQSCASGAIRA